VSLRIVKERVRPWYLRHIWFPAFPSRKPPCFDAAWQFPHLPLEGAGPLIDAAREGGRDFLFLPMTDWHVRIQRPQFLARALASLGHRCFFLNPHLGRQFQRSSDASPQIARIAPNIWELHVRLPLEPVFHHRPLREAESRILADAVELLRRVAEVSRFVQIAGFPVWRRLCELVRQSSGSPVVYDCHDLLSGFAGIDAAIVAEESALASEADLVICSADRLRDHCLHIGAHPDRCVVIRNAVTATPEIQPRSPWATHVVGYVGALEDWFDVESVKTAARALSDHRFLLAGRIESPKLQALRGIPNVEFRGEIPGEDVPGFLAQIDAALIPFLLTDLTLAADPIKLYEYLAAGLPVVSSRLPETARFADHIHFYDGPAGMAAAIRAAIDDRNDAARVRRRDSVRNETWTSRARTLLDSLPC